ncbi:MAG: M24 family metallopeptidase [Nitrospinota bacterium]
MRKSVWFPTDEYAARVRKARELMAREGIDLLFLTGDRNYIYFTGHRCIAPEGTVARPNYFMLPLEGEPHIMVHIFIEGDASSTSWVEGISSYSSLLDAPIKELAEIIRGYRVEGKKIGAELGQEQRIGMPVRDFLLLKEELKEFEFVDAAPILWKMRVVKSQRELACIRRAQEITVKGYTEGFPLVKEGMSEREIASILTGKMVEGGAEHFWIIVASGSENYQRISGKPTDRKVRRGDMVWVDMGASVNDYWADFSRGGVIGGPSDEQKRYQEVVIGTTSEGVGAVKAGVPGASIVDVCEEGMRKRGLDISFHAGRVGHGVGLFITEPPSLARWDPVILAENMVITVEPGLVREDGVYHVEENVLVTEDGSEVLSQAPRELWTLG